MKILNPSHSLLYCTCSPKITTVKSFLKFLLFKNCAYTMYLYIHNKHIPFFIYIYKDSHTAPHLVFLLLYLRNLSISALSDICVHCWSLQPHSHSVDNTMNIEFWQTNGSFQPLTLKMMREGKGNLQFLFLSVLPYSSLSHW